MLMLMLIFVTRLNSRRSRSADIFYGQSKLRWYRCVLSCDRNEPTLEAARIVAERRFQTLGAAIEKRRDAVLVLERGTDSMSRDDERRLICGMYTAYTTQLSHIWSRVCMGVDLREAIIYAVCVVHVGYCFQHKLPCNHCTDHCQSAKDIDPYFNSHLRVADLGYRKLLLILSNVLSKLRHPAHDRS